MNIRGWVYICVALMTGCSPVLPATQATVEIPPTVQNTATNVVPPTPTPTEAPTATATSVFFDEQCGIDYAEALFQNGLADYQSVPVLTYRRYESQFGNNEELSEEVLDQIAYVVAQIALSNPEDIKRVIIPQYTRTSSVIDNLQEWFQGDLSFDLVGYDNSLDMKDEGTLLVSVHAREERWDTAIWRSPSVVYRHDYSAKISGDLMKLVGQSLYSIPDQNKGGNADIAFVDGCKTALIVTPDDVNVAAVLKPDADIVNAPTTAWIVNPNEFEVVNFEDIESPFKTEITTKAGIHIEIGANPGPTPDSDHIAFNIEVFQGEKLTKLDAIIALLADPNKPEFTSVGLREYFENLTIEKVSELVSNPVDLYLLQRGDPDDDMIGKAVLAKDVDLKNIKLNYWTADQPEPDVPLDKYVRSFSSYNGGMYTDVKDNILNFNIVFSDFSVPYEDKFSEGYYTCREEYSIISSSAEAYFMSSVAQLIVIADKDKIREDDIIATRTDRVFNMIVLYNPIVFEMYPERSFVPMYCIGE